MSRTRKRFQNRKSGGGSLNNAVFGENSKELERILACLDVRDLWGIPQIPSELPADGFVAQNEHEAWLMTNGMRELSSFIQSAINALLRLDHDFFERHARLLERVKYRAETGNAADPFAELLRIRYAVLFCEREIARMKPLTKDQTKTLCKAVCDYGCAGVDANDASLPSFREFVEELNRSADPRWTSSGYSEKRLRELCQNELGMKFRQVKRRKG